MTVRGVAKGRVVPETARGRGGDTDGSVGADMLQLVLAFDLPIMYKKTTIFKPAGAEARF